MQLITMAHFGEAHGVIEKFDLKKVSSDLFEGHDLVLVITGEGPFEAAIKTSLCISKYQVSRIINLGIAGTLSSEDKIGDLIKVRTSYLLQDNKPVFKTFQLFPDGRDCLTSFERILQPEKVHPLKGLGTLVDRELWGVAMAAKTAQIPIFSIKVISDHAGSLGACEVVKDKAYEFSEKLSNALEELLQIEDCPTNERFHLPGLHFTFSTRHQIKSLLRKLSLKYDKTSDEILNQFDLHGLLSQELTPKERAKKLIEMMEHSLDPLKKKIDAQIENFKDSFARHEFNIQIDPFLEDSRVTISIEVSSDEELRSKAKTLQQLTLKPWVDLLEGKINVE